MFHSLLKTREQKQQKNNEAKQNGNINFVMTAVNFSCTYQKIKKERREQNERKMYWYYSPYRQLLS